MNVALVHYWLVRMRGGEAVLKTIMSIYPDCDVYTNVYDPAGVRELFAGRAEPKTTWTNGLPFAKKIYPLYFSLMPTALEQLRMDDYDLIVSSESGPAKWIIPPPNARHICYVHTPMRYLWDQRLEYRKKVPPIGRFAFDHLTARMRERDAISSMRVDDFVANSSYVAARIERYYRREARIIHPPVEVDDFGPPAAPEDYYLFVGHLVSYKKVEQAVDACLRLNRRLVVVGAGPMSRYVKKFEGKLIEHRPRVSRAELTDLMRKCRALLSPNVEDFGIVPVEALAAGRPVISLGRGGVVDTVTHGQTGILYDQAGVEGLVRAIQEFEDWEASFDPRAAQRRAKAFSPEAFRQNWQANFGPDSSSPRGKVISQAKPDAPRPR